MAWFASRNSFPRASTSSVAAASVSGLRSLFNLLATDGSVLTTLLVVFEELAFGWDSPWRSEAKPPTPMALARPSALVELAFNGRLGMSFTDSLPSEREDPFDVNDILLSLSFVEPLADDFSEIIVGVRVRS